MSNSSTLRIGVVLDEPMSSTCSLEPVCKWRGIAFEAAALVCEILSLTCEFELFDSYEYGKLDESGNWTGMTRALMDGRYDTSLPVFTPTYDRFQVLDFTQAYFFSNTVLVTRMPSSQSESALMDWRILDSFDWGVWLAFVAAMVASGVLLALTHKLRKGTFELPDETYWQKPRPVGDRLAFLTFSLITLVLSCAYNGATVCNKLQQQGTVPFSDILSMVECIENHECILTAPATSYSALNWLFEQGDKDPVYPKRLTQALQSNPLIVQGDDDEGIMPKILRRTDIYYATIVPESVFLSQTDFNNGCKFYVVPVPFMDINAFAFPKTAIIPARKKLEAMALVFQETGIARALENKYRLHDDVCEAARKFVLPPRPMLLLRSVYAAVLIFAIGIGVSLAFFVWELRSVGRKGSYWMLTSCHMVPKT